jgi:uncharacterized surface protein with fasciclin (FAS1) repeats
MVMVTRVFTACLLWLGLIGNIALADEARPGVVEGDADLMTTLTANPELTEFAASFEQAFGAEGVDLHLEPTAEWTVFAPANEVIPYAHTLHTEETISAYIVQGAYTYDQLWQLAEDAGDLATLTTLGGGELTIEIDGGTLLVGGIAQIRSQVGFANGYIHVIDNVLEPESG